MLIEIDGIFLLQEQEFTVGLFTVFNCPLLLPHTNQLKIVHSLVVHLVACSIEQLNII